MDLKYSVLHSMRVMRCEVPDWITLMHVYTACRIT